MHDPRGVGGGEALRDGGADLDRLARRQPFLREALAQRVSVEKLGDGVQDPVRRAEVEERKDAGVGERRHGPRLALEAGKGLLRSRKAIGEHLTATSRCSRVSRAR